MPYTQKLQIIDDEMNVLRKAEKELEQKIAAVAAKERTLRVQMLFEQKILNSAKWHYMNNAELRSRRANHPGLGDVLGRLDDYHAYIELEPGVKLCLCDNDFIFAIHWRNWPRGSGGR